MTPPGHGDRAPDYGARALARSATLNLAAQLAPAPAALLALPLLARTYPPETLGLLTMAWAVLGYFSLLDLGLGRALTQKVAATFGSGDGGRVPGLVRSTAILLTVIGSAAALATFSAAGWIASSALRVPEPLVPATRTAVRLLAAGLPFVTLASGLRGLLEARLRFDLVNAVRIPASALMYLGPVALLPFSRSIVAAVGALVAVRAGTCLAYAWLTMRVEPDVVAGPGRAPREWRALLGTGAWLTVANLAATALGVLDRLVVGALVPMGAVAYYAAPQELANKLTIVPAAISSVLFPAVSAESARGGPRAASLFARATRYTFLLLFPLAFGLAAFAPEVLGVWLGPGFATQGAPLLRWFCFGILVNGLAFVPLAVAQAGGAAPAVAWLQVVELPAFAVALWAATSRLGLAGAAAVWGIRLLVDTACLFLVAARSVGESRSSWWRSSIPLAAAGASFLLLALSPSVVWRLAILGAALAASALVAARTTDAAERDVLAAVWRRLRGAPGS